MSTGAERRGACCSVYAAGDPWTKFPARPSSGTPAWHDEDYGKNLMPSLNAALERLHLQGKGLVNVLGGSPLIEMRENTEEAAGALVQRIITIPY